MFFKQKTPQTVTEELLILATKNVHSLQCSIIEIEDTLEFYRSSHAHAVKRVVELTEALNNMKGAVSND